MTIMGFKKTRKIFLDNIEKVSSNTENLLERLGKLNIFSKVYMKKGKIIVEEQKKEIKARLSGTGQNYFHMVFPNIFGAGENLIVRGESPRYFSAMISKPLFWKKNMLIPAVRVSRTNSILDNEKVQVYDGESVLEYGDGAITIGTKHVETMHDEEYMDAGCRDKQNKSNRERTLYGKMKFGFMGFGILGEMGGVFKHHKNIEKKSREERLAGKMIECRGKDVEKYARTELERKDQLEVDFGSIGTAYLKTRIKGEYVFGKPLMNERVYLGEGLKGYKPRSITPIRNNRKIGGVCGIESQIEVGMERNGWRMFGFGGIGICSEKGSQELIDILKKSRMERGTGKNIGKSIGYGINYRGVSLVYAVPLTENDETDNSRWSINIDM